MPSPLSVARAVVAAVTVGLAITVGVVLPSCSCSDRAGPVDREKQAPAAEEVGAETPARSGVSGRVETATVAPSPAAADAPPACAGAVPFDEVVRGADGGVADALVVLRPALGPVPVPPPAPAPPRDVDLVLRRCSFQPAVQVAPVGSTLTVRSEDPLIHTAHLRLVDGGGERNVQNLVLPPSTGPVRVKLTQPGLVRVRSDQYPFMGAFILVTAGALAAVTDDEGHFDIPTAGPGDWNAAVTHAALGEATSTVEVTKTGPAALYVSLPATSR